MGDAFQVRAARNSDRATLARLWRALVDYHRELDPAYVVPDGTNAALLQEIDRGIERADCCVHVAETPDRLVGFVFGQRGSDSRRGDAEPADAWIHELWVEPDWRRRGVASALVRAAIEQLGAPGRARLSVRVESRNETGLAFWERFGFGERARILERADERRDPED